MDIELKDSFIALLINNNFISNREEVSFLFEKIIDCNLSIINKGLPNLKMKIVGLPENVLDFYKDSFYFIHDNFYLNYESLLKENNFNLFFEFVNNLIYSDVRLCGVRVIGADSFNLKSLIPSELLLDNFVSNFLNVYPYFDYIDFKYNDDVIELYYLTDMGLELLKTLETSELDLLSFNGTFPSQTDLINLFEFHGSMLARFFFIFAFYKNPKLLNFSFYFCYIFRYGYFIPDNLGVVDNEVYSGLKYIGKLSLYYELSSYNFSNYFFSLGNGILFPQRMVFDLLGNDFWGVFKKFKLMDSCFYYKITDYEQLF